MRGVVVAAAVAFTALWCVSAHIIVVDMGSDSMKVALVKPGLAFQVVNNFQSKRKVCVVQCVMWRCEMLACGGARCGL